MSMTSILTIALKIVKNQPVRLPAMSKQELCNLLDCVAVLRKEAI